MKKHKIFKRTIAFMLAAMLAVSCVPTQYIGAAAVETEEIGSEAVVLDEEETVEIEVSDETETETDSSVISAGGGILKAQKIQ